MSGKLVRKRKVRAGHRMSTRKIISSVEEILETFEKQDQPSAIVTTKLRQQKLLLQEKLDTIRNLDEDILAVVSEGQIDEEICEADEFMEFTQLAIMRIDAALTPSQLNPSSKLAISPLLAETSKGKSKSPGNISTASEIHPSPSKSPGDDATMTLETHLTPPTSFENVSMASEVHLTSSTLHGNVLANSETPLNPSTSGIFNTYNSGTQVKLPKLDLRKFDGDISKWPSFWDAFESAVHSNTKLAPIDKFNYLNSLLVKSAYEAISGLSLTAANYDEAVAILKRRFGNKQLIINKHMETLLNINSVKSGLNIQALRQLHDLIESHVRSLKSLGVSSSSYGSLLSSVVMSKLPQDLRLIVTREVRDEWDLDHILDVFRSELEARERANGNNISPTDQSLTKPPYNRGRRALPLSTDAALFATGSKPTCTYCRENHASNVCRNVTSIAARKEILKRAGRCFVCLKRNHISKDCSSRMKCLKCGRQHHISICTSDANNEVQSLNTTNVEGLASLPQSRTSHDPPKESSGRPTVLYVNASTPILLQTAKAAIYRPGQPNEKFLARLILDTGSQRSYVTTTVKDKLRLPSERKQTISVKTFGSTEENTQSVDVVNLCISTEHGDDVQLSAFVVPLICDPLQNQSIVHANVTHAHLRGLRLADYSTGEDDLMVDILVGSDQYWQLVSGKVLRGEDGLTAIQTRLGWVLSGPTNGAVQNGQQQNNLVTTHVLKTATKPVDITNESLDGSLRRFWDLETLGIRPRSVYEEFEESITFKTDRYEVHLPWKRPHPILPDNYELSMRRLCNLLKRLNQDPEVLKEYDSVIKEQLKNGIVEVVGKPADGEVGKTHYLPHHAVIRRDKATTKLRVVYDASARSNGAALNDCLYTGPPLAENIFDILLRFRASRIALTGDVEKAFLMVSIAEEDRDVIFVGG
ncbi:uncharacterized protein LOC122949186 [Acropora millepora]|uniref:uncharacterized protein LOC122949186 n=1 Tax=Acropora millepora TaxID=45264 RepID=UPI001CF39B6E|nr:uncharacterized protein LOC122949186 [Acropora millepora]